jgi:hypothetical protein
MPDSLGRDQKGENTRSQRGKCHMKDCRKKPVTEVTFFNKKVMVCKGHEHVDGVK